MDWYLDVLKKYAVFTGRSRRKECWMFILFNFIITYTLSFIGGFLGSAIGALMSMLVLLYSFAVLLPSVGVSIRRLHDTNRSGWFLLIGVVPVIGTIILIVLLAIDSQPGDNQYGPNPKAGQHDHQAGTMSFS